MQPDVAAAFQTITPAADAATDAETALADQTLGVTFDFSHPSAAPDIVLDAPPDDAAAKTNMIDFNFDTTPSAPAVEKQDMPGGLSMDFDLGDAAKSDTAVAEPAPFESDFILDVAAPAATAPAATAPAAAPVIPKLKFDDIDLNLDEAPKLAPDEGGAKDDHWYDVQTKFDLAKAYQEMGDKEGASEILQEVINEGDAGQQVQAKRLLESLG
jgi:pilus assembly protein FimV